MPAVPERPVLVAPDSFKGTFRAAEVAGAIGRGLERAGLMPPDLCPVADGGEGTMEALLLALGGETVGVEVQEPLGRPVQSQFGLVEDGGTAVIEMAAASGLGLVSEDERDAWAASTYGTGELICAAAAAGAQVILVGVGGSATTDGGAGALAAIEDHGGLRRGADGRADRRADAVRARPGGVRAAEGRRRRDGGAARGAAGRAGGELPRDPRGVPMTGAAGGLAAGSGPRTAPRLEAGAPFILDALDFDARMRAARAVVTGEGKLDEQTLEGKLVGEIGTRTRQAGVPLHAIVGTDRLDGVRQADHRPAAGAGGDGPGRDRGRGRDARPRAGRRQRLRSLTGCSRSLHLRLRSDLAAISRTAVRWVP